MSADYITGVIHGTAMGAVALICWPMLRDNLIRKRRAAHVVVGSRGATITGPLRIDGDVTATDVISVGEPPLTNAFVREIAREEAERAVRAYSAASEAMWRGLNENAAIINRDFDGGLRAAVSAASRYTPPTQEGR